MYVCLMSGYYYYNNLSQAIFQTASSFKKGL